MKIIKYLVIGVVGICVLVLAALLVLPSLVNVEKYKPEIERFASERSGYPITLKGDIDLSFFPWTGLSFENLVVGNPPGFTSTTFVKVKRFKTGVKLLSLVRGNVEIDSFIVDGPEIVIERTKEGRWNWQPKKKNDEKTVEKISTREKETKSVASQKENRKSEPGKGALPIKSFAVGEFAITAGRILIDDKQAELKKELSNFTMVLSNISLDSPVGIESSWLLDGQGGAISGTLGPLGSNPGRDPISFELQLSGMEVLEATVKGTVENLLAALSYNVNISVSPFNPREAAEKLGMAFPVRTSDPAAISRFGMDLSAEGNVDSLAGSKMVATLDETTMTVQARAANFTGPDLDIELDVDRINLDRYLPPPIPKNDETEVAVKKAESGDIHEKKQSDSVKSQQVGNGDNGKQTSAGASKKTDFTLLRKLVLNLKAELREITVHGGRIDQVSFDVSGKDGLFRVKQAIVRLYEGISETNGELSFQREQPDVRLINKTNNVLAGPLLLDFTGKEFLEGTAFIDAEVTFSGQEPEAVKKSLNGKGTMRFEDGAIVGVDLAQMARQVKSGFTQADQGEKPKTDFAELMVPFSINSGILNTENTSLQSPFLRVAAHGDADLVRELLNMKVKPKIVGTIKGQGDTEERSGVTVPLVVSGPFNKPEFALDLESAVKDELLDQKKIEKILENEEVSEDTRKAVKEGAELLKSLFGN